MIADSLIEEYQILNKEIKFLLEINQELNNIKTVKIMKKIIPEFKSLNSEYEKLDK